MYSDVHTVKYFSDRTTDSSAVKNEMRLSLTVVQEKKMLFKQSRQGDAKLTQIA